MSVAITVTGTAGPGNTVAAQVFNNCDWFNIDTVNNIISFDSNGIKTISIAAAATITVTKSGSVYTLAIS